MRELGRVPDKKYACLSPNDYICEKLDFSLEKNLHLLKTDAPGVAIWSCYLQRDKKVVGDRLCELLKGATDNLYRYNLAIALGIVGDERALPVLREIVENRDCFFFTDNRRSNQFRSAIAVCLLGRLGTEEDLPLLFELLTAEEIGKLMYNTLTAKYLYHHLPDRNFVYFAMLTHACMAIYKIYKRHNLPLKELNEKFERFFIGESIISKITDAKKGEFAYQDIEEFINCMLKITK